MKIALIIISSAWILMGIAVRYKSKVFRYGRIDAMNHALGALIASIIEGGCWYCLISNIVG